MSLSVAAGAAPIFLSKNYVNLEDAQNSGVAVSSGTLAHRLYDMDPSIQWSSSGSSDGVTETVTISLYEQGTLTSRSIDFVALLNHNLQRFIIEYSNDTGSTWTTITGGDYTGSDYSGANIVLVPTAFTANMIRVTATDVQSGSEKLIGLVVAALSSFQADQAMAAYVPKRTANRKEVILADGSTDYTHLLWSDNSFELYGASMKWLLAGSTLRTNLRTLATQQAPFIVYPEPGELPQEIHLCIMASGGYSEEYASSYKTAGWNIGIDISEVGSG